MLLVIDVTNQIDVPVLPVKCREMRETASPELRESMLLP